MIEICRFPHQDIQNTGHIHIPVIRSYIFRGSACRFDADPDLTFHVDPDPDHTLSFTHIGKAVPVPLYILLSFSISAIGDHNFHDFGQYIEIILEKISDILVWIQIRILLFSSLIFKTPTKKLI